MEFEEGVNWLWQITPSSKNCFIIHSKCFLVKNNHAYHTQCLKSCGLHLSVSRQVQKVFKGMLSHADTTVFSKQQKSSVKLQSCCSCQDFRQQFDYFFLVKHLKCSAILQRSMVLYLFPGLLSFQTIFLAIMLYYRCHFLHNIFVNFFQIWSMLHVAGYEELAV